MEPARVGVVGLGLMGGSIASRLLTEGFAVDGYDPADGTPGLAERGLTRHRSLAGLAAHVDTVVLSLPDGSFSEQVCTAPDGLAAADGTRVRVVLDTTTLRPREAERLAQRLADQGIAYFDVGLSGSSLMVARGHGLALIGGATRTPDHARAVLSAICSDVAEVGGAGDGMRAKLITNMVLGLNRLALAEALVMAEKMDMDTGVILGVLQRGAAASRAMEIWGPRMVDGRFTEPTSRIRQHVKDVRQMLELGEEHGLPMLGAAQLAMVARVGVAAGWSELDNSAQVETVRRMAGLEPRVPPDRD